MRSRPGGQEAQLRICTELLVAPHETLRELAGALPEEMRGDVVIVGSLAAAVRFFPPESEQAVRTKDIDCLLTPRLRALSSGRQATESLMARGWKMRADANWGQPGDADTSEPELPLVRLVPPGGGEWFLELLSAPAATQTEARELQRLVTRHGHFVLCSFRFLALAEFDPLSASHGLKIARPEMMALANLLHHPTIGRETMAGLIGDRSIKRANKDLGRVLALAYLAERESESALESWPVQWIAAIRETFPGQSDKFQRSLGTGLEELLSDSHGNDLEEAHHTCISGLLAGYRVSPAVMRATGRRLIEEVIRPVRDAR